MHSCCSSASGRRPRAVEPRLPPRVGRHRPRRARRRGHLPQQLLRAGPGPGTRRPGRSSGRTTSRRRTSGTWTRSAPACSWTWSSAARRAGRCSAPRATATSTSSTAPLVPRHLGAELAERRLLAAHRPALHRHVEPLRRMRRGGRVRAGRAVQPARERRPPQPSSMGGHANDGAARIAVARRRRRRCRGRHGAAGRTPRGEPDSRPRTCGPGHDPAGDCAPRRHRGRGRLSPGPARRARRPLDRAPGRVRPADRPPDVEPRCRRRSNRPDRATATATGRRSRGTARR